MLTKLIAESTTTVPTADGGRTAVTARIEIETDVRDPNNILPTLQQICADVAASTQRLASQDFDPFNLPPDDNPGAEDFDPRDLIPRQ